MSDEFDKQAGEIIDDVIAMICNPEPLGESYMGRTRKDLCVDILSKPLRKLGEERDRAISKANFFNESLINIKAERDEWQLKCLRDREVNLRLYGHNIETIPDDSELGTFLKERDELKLKLAIAVEALERAREIIHDDRCGGVDLDDIKNHSGFCEEAREALKKIKGDV